MTAEIGNVVGIEGEMAVLWTSHQDEARDPDRRSEPADWPWNMKTQARSEPTSPWHDPIDTEQAFAHPSRRHSRLSRHTATKFGQ